MNKITLILVCIIYESIGDDVSNCRKNETYLDCKHMELAVIPDLHYVSDKITHLDFSFNKIKVVSAINIKNPSSILDMSLSHNSVDTIVRGTFDNLTNLQNLDLSYNQITGSSLHIETFKYEIGHFKNTKKISFRGNHLGTLERLTFTAHAFRSLEYLDLSHCSLSTLEHMSIENLARLKYLDLSHNQLSNFEALSLEGLTNLETLDLSYNNINVLSEFPMLISLKNLYLDNNGLRDINENVLSVLLSLEVLSLTNNKLKTLKPNILPLDSLTLKEVRLDDNPWYCDCKMRWILEEQQNELMFNNFTLKCELPPRFRRRNIYNIPKKDLKCYNEYSKVLFILITFISLCFIMGGISWFIYTKTKFLRCRHPQKGNYDVVFDRDDENEEEEEIFNIKETTEEAESLVQNEEKMATENEGIHLSDD